MSTVETFWDWEMYGNWDPFTHDRYMDMTPDERTVLQLYAWKAGRSQIAWGLSRAYTAEITETSAYRVRKADEGLVRKGLVAMEEYRTPDGGWATYSYVLYPKCCDYTVEDLRIRVKDIHVPQPTKEINPLPVQSIDRTELDELTLIRNAYNAADVGKDWFHPKLKQMISGTDHPIYHGFSDPRTSEEASANARVNAMMKQELASV